MRDYNQASDLGSYLFRCSQTLVINGHSITPKIFHMTAYDSASLYDVVTRSTERTDRRAEPAICALQREKVSTAQDLMDKFHVFIELRYARHFLLKPNCKDVCAVYHERNGLPSSLVPYCPLTQVFYIKSKSRHW